MTSPRFDVLGIGNAIVDILAEVPDDFLSREHIHKGTMTLIDAARADELVKKIGKTVKASGGSAANTMAGLAALGARAAYIGKVYDDALGNAFADDMRKRGVQYQTPFSKSGLPTACCIIVVTPDGQRSMNTFLGASTDLSETDIDEALIAAARMTYLEGYLFDKPPAQKAFYRAAACARKHERKIALSLSDPFCVNRHRAAFHAFIKSDVDVVFANEAEACALYEKNTLEETTPLLGRDCALAVVTRSEQGCLIIDKGAITAIPAVPVAKVIDTTGAGDLFAAGFLYGMGQNMPLSACGRIAAGCAAEVISHIGPRPREGWGIKNVG